MDQAALALAGWRTVAALVLLLPLVQGGTPRLPVLVFELAALALAAAWALGWARGQRREVRVAAADGLGVLLLFWGLFSTLFAAYYHAAERTFLLLVAALALYWFLAYNPSLAGLRAALSAVRLQAAFQAALVLWQRLGAGEQRPAGTFFNPNFLAGFLAVAAVLALGPVLFGAGEPGRRGPRRWGPPLAEAALLVLALVLTGSRGGVVALAAGLGVLLGMRSLRLAAAVGAAGVLLLALVPNPLTERIRSLGEEDDYAWTRVAIWRSAWSMTTDHPWVGVGIGQFEQQSQRYAFPVKTHWAKYSRSAESAHSEYLQAAAELGVPGLLLALAALGLLVEAAVRRRRAPVAAREREAPLLAGLAAIAAQSVVDLPLHTPPGALLALTLAAGVRLHGLTGPSALVAVRLRRPVAAAVVAVAALLGLLAARPVAGFWLFLRGIGAPPNLLHETWALELAPRAEVSLPESVRLLGLAAAVDFPSAPYHRAVGSRHFQGYMRGELAPESLERALYHINLAIALNPDSYQYRVNLGQAMESLATRFPPGEERLAEAMRQYRAAAALAPFQYKIQGEIGRLAERLGDPAAAEDAFRRAVETEEYYLQGWLNLGAFYARAGRFAEARAAFGRGAALAERARTLVPASPIEEDLIAPLPADFYNELEKLERIEPTEAGT